jgi:outer membrane protein insertion porin family
VDLGRKIETGNLIIQGNRVTKDDVILRHVKHLSHIKWDLEKIAAAQTRLLKTGLFKTVEIKETAETSSNAVKDLAVQLKERETGELDFLIGYDTEDGVHLASELAQRNYHGSGNTLAFGVDGFVRSGNQVLDAGRARALYSIKGFLDSQNDLDNELFAQFAVKLVDQFSYDRVGLASNIKSEILDQSIFTTGVSVYRENLFDVEQDVQLGEHDVGDSFYSLLSANIDLDKRDDVFNPRSGYRTQFGVDLSSSIFGSEANFYNFDVQHGFYFPVSSILTLGNNIHFQLVRPFGGDSVVPLSRRLFLGGRNSLRGYSRHSVGPMGDLGNVVGGDTAINYSLELQLSVTENVATLVFMDIGQNILKEKGTFTGDALDFNSFKYTPGIGLRYKTPIGPISAEYGFVLNRKDSDPSGQFHIAIGASF